MIATALLAIWTSLLCLSSSYAADWWMKRRVSTEKAAPAHALEHKKTRVINVPVIADGQVRGYVVAQFNYAADPEALKTMPIPADAIISDEAFRMLYAEEKIDFRKLQKPDLTRIVDELKARVARKLKSDAIKELLVQEFNYVSKEELRK